MGKQSAPQAPDYTAAAEKTAAGNLEAAKYATKANRVNQYTPYGNLTYEEKPDGTWSQTQTLTPQAQATLDKQMALSDKYADTASQGFDKVQGLLSNPELDQSQLPARAMNVGQTAQEAIMSRLQPQLAQQEEALRTRLANQGITLGSDAYGKEMTAQGQRGNDLQLQAALQGISLDQANFRRCTGSIWRGYGCLQRTIGSVWWLNVWSIRCGHGAGRIAGRWRFYFARC